MNLLSYYTEFRQYIFYLSFWEIKRKYYKYANKASKKENKNKRFYIQNPLLHHTYYHIAIYDIYAV